MNKKLLLTGLCFALLSACETTTAVAPEAKEKTYISFVRSDRIEEEIGSKSPISMLAVNQQIEQAEEKNSALKETCTTTAPFKQSGLEILFAGIAIDLFFNQIEKKIAEAIKKYTTTYGAKRTTYEIYSDINIPKLAYNCFVLRRILVDPNIKDEEVKLGNAKIQFELVGHMSVLNDTLRVRPLRFYLGEPGAQNKDADEWALTTNLKAVSTWRDVNYEGKDRILYDGKFHSAKVQPVAKGKPVYYSWDKNQSTFNPVANDPSAVEMPLPSITSGYSVPTGTLRIELMVGEVGKNSFLEAIQKVFAAGKGPSVKLLKESSEKLLE